MVPKMSGMDVMRPRAWARVSAGRVAVRRRVPAGRGGPGRALDVGEQRPRPEPERVGWAPPAAELVLEGGGPLERLFRGADSSGRLQADQLARALAIVADGASHDQPDRQ